MLRPATPLTILLFAAFALLLISVISTPIIKAIPLASFEGFNFGVFGYCKGDDCSPFEIGYDTENLFSKSSTATFDLPVGTRTTLSSILILHPIAAFFTLIMMCLSAAAHLHSPSHSPRYLLGVFILSILTLILTLLSFLIDVLLFVPHMAWGSYLVLAATVLVAASGIVSCAMRRTLVSRKARAKRIAENAEMNGENFYNRQANEPVAPLVPNPPMMVNGAPGGDKLPGFATFTDMQKKEDPTRTSDERIPLTSRTPTERSQDGQLPMRQGSNDRYGNPPMRGGMAPNRGGYGGPPGRDEYGNLLPTPGPYGPGSRDPSRDRMQNGYGGNGYGPPGGPPGGPGNYRGRGGPYRGRGGPVGPGGPGYGRGGFNPQMRGGYGPPGGQGRGPPMGGMPPGAMMRGGRGPPPGYGAPQYRGESPAGYGPDGRMPMAPGNAYAGSDNNMPPSGGFAAYNGGESRDSLPRAESPPPLPGDGPGPVGQAIEMDATTGSPSHAPKGFGQYGNNRIRDSDSDVAGMISLQQPNVGVNRHISESSKYSSDEPYVPPRAAWQGQGRSSPLGQSSGPEPTGSSLSHRRQTSGEYFEDVDPRFAEPSQRPADLQTLSSNPLPSSLTPGYTTASSGPMPNRDPNSLGHPSRSNPHLGLDGNRSYEDLQEGARSPAESERSNFTSVSQRGVNPKWNPQNGPGGFGQPMNRRPPGPPQRNNDILLDTNPDFGLPQRGGRGGPNGRSPVGGGGMVPRSAYEGGNGM